MSAERGQASVEMIGALPLLAVVALAVAQLLAAGSAREAARSGAHAGAMAVLQGGDPVGAAWGAMGGLPRSRGEVVVRGTAVRVEVRPRRVLPGTAELLTAVATADGGSR